MRWLACSLLALAVTAPSAGPAVAQTPITLDQAMAHPDWIGPPVEQAWWSLDGRQAYYTLKREGALIRDTHVLDLASGASRVLADAAQATMDAANPAYNRDRSLAVFVRNGDVFVRDLRNGTLTQVTRSAETAADAAFSADGQAVIWRVGHDWYRWRFAERVVEPAVLLRAEKDPAAPPAEDYLRDMQLRLIATLKREKDQRDGLRERGEALRRADASRAAAPVYLGDGLQLVRSALSPAGHYAIAVTEPKNGDRGRRGQMPKYVTESGYEEFEDVRTRVGRNPPLGHGLRLVDLAGGNATELTLDPLPGIAVDPLADLRRAAGKEPQTGNRRVRVDGVRWSADGANVAVMLRATDNKDRWIATVDFAKKALVPVHRLTDPAWINWAFNDFGWLPDGRTLWFLSEESGYSHLYTVVPGQRPQRRTEGRWEVDSPVLSADGSRAFFLCNRRWPGDWKLCRLDLASNTVVELTDLDGVESFVLSPDESQVLLRWSSSHVPPQLAVMAASGGEVRRLTDTRSAAYRARDWLAPQFVQVPSRHGAGHVWAKLYRPAELEPGKKYPIALFVHGAGYLQNVHARWPVYFREQMFHQLLVQHGYVVLDMDFRGSAGYGRDWRTAIYRQMGHPELEDYLDGIDYLVEQHQGDRDRVGIYGGSYGGFMTFMAMFREPERFHAGAALRPVTDWAMYNHEYTSNILNTPDIDPEAYRKSSPIEYVERLQGHLLISHGMIDDNVLYQDSVRLAQRLIELKKHDWELASYPLERHAYQHPESWYDQYRRIFDLFERALKTPK